LFRNFYILVSPSVMPIPTFTTRLILLLYDLFLTKKDLRDQGSSNGRKICFCDRGSSQDYLRNPYFIGSWPLSSRTRII